MAEPLNLLLASDFSARCDRPLDRALLLVRERGAKLAIAHILEPGPDRAELRSPDELERDLRAELPEEAWGVELIVRAGSAPHVLAAIAKESGSDLIITGVARYNSWGDYFVGTAVDYIVRNAEVPVLIVRKRPRKPYQRMLVTTDFSDCSVLALRTAARLFPDIPITVVHVFHIPYKAWLESQSVREEIRAERAAEMAKLIARPTLVDLKDRLSTVIAEGELGPVITQQLKLTASDLLVLGTQGQSTFSYATIGSNAEALMASAPSDVLMVRTPK